MGQVTATIPRDGGSERHTQKLMNKGRHHDTESQGSVTFTVECVHNLRATQTKQSTTTARIDLSEFFMKP